MPKHAHAKDSKDSRDSHIHDVILDPADNSPIKESVRKASDAAHGEIVEDFLPAERPFDKSGAIALLREGQRYAQHALSRVAIPEYAAWIKKVSEFLVTNI